MSDPHHPPTPDSGPAGRGRVSHGRAIYAALAANLSVAAAKLAAFAITGSAAMLSEAIHSLSDTVNQALLLVGGRHSTRRADAEHQFGYGRARYVWAFVVSIVLFVLGGGVAAAEGIARVRDPVPLDHPGVAVTVLILALGLEGASLRTAIGEARKARGRRSLLRWLRSSRNPELPVVLAEDSAALVGLGIALAGVTASALTGNGLWDGVASIAVGALLLTVAALLASEVGSMLIGESALPEEQQRIAAAILEDGRFLRMANLRTLHVAPEELLVAAKVLVSPGTTADQVTDWVDGAEARLRLAVPTARWVFIETATPRPGPVRQVVR